MKFTTIHLLFRKTKAGTLAEPPAVTGVPGGRRCCGCWRGGSGWCFENIGPRQGIYVKLCRRLARSIGEKGTGSRAVPFSFALGAAPCERRSSYETRISSFETASYCALRSIEAPHMTLVPSFVTASNREECGTHSLEVTNHKQRNKTPTKGRAPVLIHRAFGAQQESRTLTAPSLLSRGTLCLEV